MCCRCCNGNRWFVFSVRPSRWRSRFLFDFDWLKWDFTLYFSPQNNFSAVDLLRSTRCLWVCAFSISITARIYNICHSLITIMTTHYRREKKLKEIRIIFWRSSYELWKSLSCCGNAFTFISRRMRSAIPHFWTKIVKLRRFINPANGEQFLAYDMWSECSFGQAFNWRGGLKHKLSSFINLSSLITHGDLRNLWFSASVFGSRNQASKLLCDWLCMCNVHCDSLNADSLIYQLNGIFDYWPMV